MNVQLRVRDAAQTLRPPAGLELVHLSPTIGTEVLGVDLRQPLTRALQDFLQALFLERKVIFFRDQDLSAAQHLAFGALWGELEVMPAYEHHPDHPEILVLKRNADTPPTENIWHSDATWRECPPLGSILRAHIVPQVGGDTLFADMDAAYEALPDWMKRALDGLAAVHSIANSHAPHAAPDRVAELRRAFPPQSHPIVRTHPQTGRKTIFVNRVHTSYVEGVSPEDSRYLLERLYAQAAVPEFQCRFRWRPNSIAFWDNRACQHYAVADYYPAARHMERVTVIGDKPF